MTTAPAIEPKTPVTETERVVAAPANGSSRQTSKPGARADIAEAGTSHSSESMITDLEKVVRERESYRATLERIAELIEAELSAYVFAPDLAFIRRANSLPSTTSGFRALVLAFAGNRNRY